MEMRGNRMMGGSSIKNNIEDVLISIGSRRRGRQGDYR